jgi:hypothetical protein
MCSTFELDRCVVFLLSCVCCQQARQYPLTAERLLANSKVAGITAAGLLAAVWVSSCKVVIGTVICSCRGHVVVIEASVAKPMC